MTETTASTVPAEHVPTEAKRRALGLLLPGFEGTTLPRWLAARLEDGLAGVCLFAENIESRAQLRALTTAIRQANPFAIIAIDEEGGDVTRLYSDQGSPYPGNALLGRIDDLDYTERTAREVGWELRDVGVNLDFAPDIDINSNSDNPVIGTRSFGVDPELVARHSVAWVRGLQSTGVAASVKHFPGHGDTADDSHLALPVIDLSASELAERELLPFGASILAGTKTVMTSHILLPRLDAERPATLSPRILQGLLRSQLGFTGVIVSDALDMTGASGVVGIPAAAALAVAAGCDLLCIGTKNTDAQLDRISEELSAAISRGELPEDRFEDALGRVDALAHELEFERVSRPAPALPGRDDEEVLERLTRAVESFDVRAHAPIEAGYTIVAIETAANIAVGSSPWGLAAAGLDVVAVHQGGALPVARQLVIVGKDNHRRAWVRELIDEGRRRSASTVVIDMGWPSDDRAYADISTFGASRFVGQALAGWLRDAARPTDGVTL